MTGTSEQRSRRVLAFLFHFPPVNAVSTPRNVRTVRYLPQYGWRPVVVTPRETSDARDPASIALIPPAASVVRTRLLEPRHLHPVAQLARLMGRGVRAVVPRGVGIGPRPVQQSAPNAITAPDRVSPILRFQRLLFFPDNQVGWLPFALVAALREHRARPVDVIYSTSAPYTAHLAGGVLKLLIGRPWVAEFRDPWLGSPIALAMAGPRPWLHRRLQVKIERWIVHAADRVVFVSPSTARAYRRRYPKAPPFAVITNGHDPSDLVVRHRERGAGDRFRIVYAGTVRPRELEALLQAVASLVDRRPALRDELELHFYGDLSAACRGILDHFVGSAGLSGMVQDMGMVARRVALEALVDADAALIMLGGDTGMGQIVPAKLFECIGQSQQVLAILPRGDARDILDELGWGVIASPDSVDIELAIEQLLATPAPRDRKADPRGIYDGVRLAGRLAETLDSATGLHSRGNPGP